MITNITVNNDDGTSQVFTIQAAVPVIETITVPLGVPVELVAKVV